MQIQVVARGIFVLLDQKLRIDLSQYVLGPEYQRGEVFSREDVDIRFQKFLY
jgi:hypothetical protein